MKDKLRPCPFCKSTHENRWTWIDKLENHENQYILLHYCNPQPTKYDRVISVYGDTKEECIERWNACGEE